MVFPLSADLRFCQINPENDQVWSLIVRQEEKPQLLLETTFGLRAKSMHIFPEFKIYRGVSTENSGFIKPPIISDFYSNYIKTVFSPLSGIECTTEFWCAESDTIACRMLLINDGETKLSFRTSWVFDLVPQSPGLRLSPEKIDGANILVGQSDNIYPVIFMTGGPEAVNSPYPNLFLDLTLHPGEERKITWVHSAAEEKKESISRARRIASRNWDAEIQWIEMENKGLVEIVTGVPEWDFIFAMGQSLLVSLIEKTHEAAGDYSLLQSRGPDQIKKEKVHESIVLWYLLDQLLPGYPDIVKNLLEDLFSEEKDVDEQGKISPPKLYTPLLAAITKRLYEVTGDQIFLARIYPKLWDQYSSWFSEKMDLDLDGYPEWSDPAQTGFVDNPLFARWYPWAQGVDINYIEAPSLAGFLFNEGQALLELCTVSGYQEHKVTILDRNAVLQKKMEESWNSKRAVLEYRDRDTHLCVKGKKAGEIRGNDSLEIQEFFTEPTRLLIRINTHAKTLRLLKIALFGSSASGKPVEEKFNRDDFLWYLDSGIVTTSKVFSSLGKLEIQGLDDHDKITLESVDHRQRDHSMFIPFFAGMLDEKVEEKLIKRTLLKNTTFWRKHGVPALAVLPSNHALAANHIYLEWNSLIGMGLASRGYISEAAELLKKLISMISDNYQREYQFRRFYDADTGIGAGEPNTIMSLPPLGLFLKTLGVEIISPWKVRLTGGNPFQKTVTIRYKGLEICRMKKKTFFTFPNGESAQVDGLEPCVVTLSHKKISPYS
ncbi:MAG: hypothetical protein JXA19_04170 [Anaerolineales bacterium]|nr:hypothetical protein [Anaerolineales bacterium]